MFLLTRNDLLSLEHHRLERLCSFFPSTLTCCLLQFDQPNVLTIHCSEPWLVDHLLSEIDRLCYFAWLTVAAEHVSICFVQEEIYRTSTHDHRTSQRHYD